MPLGISETTKLTLWHGNTLFLTGAAKASLDAVPQTITAEKTTSLAGSLVAAACQLVQKHRRFITMHCFSKDFWHIASCLYIFWAQEQGQRAGWNIVRICEAPRLGYQQHPPPKLWKLHNARSAEQDATVPLTEMQQTPDLCCS